MRTVCLREVKAELSELFLIEAENPLIERPWNTIKEHTVAFVSVTLLLLLLLRE